VPAPESNYRFGCHFDGIIRLGKIKQILTSIRNTPEHNKIDINDIFVTGEMSRRDDEFPVTSRNPISIRLSRVTSGRKTDSIGKGR